MSLNDNCVGVGAIPRPMNLMCGDSLEVTLFTLKGFVLDKKPDLTLENVVDLLSHVRMRSGVITGCPNGIHQAAFVTVGPLDRHPSFPLFRATNHLTFRYILGFDV